MMNSYDLNYKENILLKEEMKVAAKSPTVGLLAALFLGGAGAHRFYLDDIMVGVVFLVLGIVSVGLSKIAGVPDFIGYTPIAIGVVEALFMQNRVKEWNEALETKITKSIICERTAPPVKRPLDDAVKVDAVKN